MSYLNFPRLVFSGDFQADVNTVNNDVRHYYNPAFSEDNWVQDISGQGGWWNPEGGSTFRLVDCSVKQVSYPDGTSTHDPAKDSVIGKNVSGPLNESSAKIVDLDPQFQFTSQIWGLKLCIYGADDEVLLTGTVKPSGFKDLQIRNFPATENGQFMGASWTSVMHDLKWGKNAGESKILSELMNKSEASGMLSCQLTSFGYFKVIGGERFSLGRLLGAIAPYVEGDPQQFAPARRLISLDLDYNETHKNQIFPPEFTFNNCYYEVTEKQAILTVDLGGSFPLKDPLGTPKDYGEIYIGVAKASNLRDLLTATAEGKYFTHSDQILKIGPIDYLAENWLLNTAGITDFTVTGEAKELLKDHQIVLYRALDDGNSIVLACETTDGLSVRADDNVRRIDTKSSGPIDFEFKIRTYQWGKTLPGANVFFMRHTPPEKEQVIPTGIDSTTGQVIEPTTNWPAKAVLLNGVTGSNNEDGEKHFPAPPIIKSDEQGVATVTVSVSNPENKRGYIDGQIFLISYRLEGLPIQQQYYVKFLDLFQMDALILHVRDPFEEIKVPDWSDLAEIMTQYRNLYPIMSKNILDLSNPKEIAARQRIMLYAFTRDIHDPTYMPVSRDLSEGKRKTIVNWLNTGMKGADEATNLRASMPKASTPPLPEEGHQYKAKLKTKTKDDYFME